MSFFHWINVIRSTCPSSVFKVWVSQKEKFFYSALYSLLAILNYLFYFILFFFVFEGCGWGRGSHMVYVLIKCTEMAMSDSWFVLRLISVQNILHSLCHFSCPQLSDSYDTNA